MTHEERDSYFELLRKEQVKKLTDVGFTEEQARVLLEIMQTKAFSGGIF